MGKGFVIENYGRKSCFAGFLPGICGLDGIPVWCYYVSRGQGVVSFGTRDKNEAIMEFYPAHQAYQNVKRTGFRTFIRKGKATFEPFGDERVRHAMCVRKNSLSIQETNKAEHIETKVTYYALPKENVGALVRMLEITNIGSETAELEILDGMPALIPFGVDMDNLKNMGQTVKAWMQVEDVDKKEPYFRVRASVKDSTSVEKIEKGNFALGFLQDGTKLMPITDPDLVFAYDTSLGCPVDFFEKGLDALLGETQITQNKFPCCFFGTKAQLRPGESKKIFQVIGQAASKEILHDFAAQITDGHYFEEKYEQAENLTDQLTREMQTSTAKPEFDEYCRYTYMDNVLRGGYPITLAKDKTFYVYGRKHGDLERDYNDFCMLPENYSQGNGNFRDMNQNRRCDVFFHPEAAMQNIELFYNCIQMDGYNPLKIEMVSYKPSKKIKERYPFLPKSYTPGELINCLNREMESTAQKVKAAFEEILENSEESVNVSFGEGYWTDHWTYNLDLVEAYLAIYPEREHALLFDTPFYYQKPFCQLLPRRKRYAKTDRGLRQYRYLTNEHKSGGYVKDASGKDHSVSLLEKLLLLSALKVSTLDAWGCGVEMEGGKPGWYDALNGLPGLFGSSLAETAELERMICYTKEALMRYPGTIPLTEEAADFLETINHIVQEFGNGAGENLLLWNAANDAKEHYRERIYHGISGKKVSKSTTELVTILEHFCSLVRVGLQRAETLTNMKCPTYLAYQVTEYEENASGITPLHFEPVILPMFLEGPVRNLKREQSLEEKRALYQYVRKSPLYDQALSMYKVNAPLEDCSHEVGRARAFTPGWLENESIWLHMEYKYLLELLKSGLYPEFAADFRKAAVPFLKPDVYGRSIFENSSFLASSANPDPACRGKGFVARLSGSTAEFINMWILMFFGKKIFSEENGTLVFCPQPILPHYLIPKKKTVSARFLGETEVIYHFADDGDWFGDGVIDHFALHPKNGEAYTVDAPTLSGIEAEAVRDRKFEKIEIFIKR